MVPLRIVVKLEKILGDKQPTLRNHHNLVAKSFGANATLGVIPYRLFP